MQEQNINFDEVRRKSLFTQNDETLLPTLQLSDSLPLIHRRDLLRNFLKDKGFKQPEFCVANNFAQISAWAVKRNKFPVLLKTAINKANNHDLFILKAFRELPDFFSALGEQQEALIEGFFPAKARLEATFFNGNLNLVSQTGAARSLNYHTAWRVYPVFPPPSCLKEVKKTAACFVDLLRLKNLPFRLTFAFNSGQTTPLSLNLGFNRHEYFTEFGNFLNKPQDFPARTKELFKILFYQVPDNKLELLDERDLSRLLQTTLYKLEIAATTVILLRSENPTELLDDSKKADSFFKHLGGEEMLSPEES